MAFFLGILGSPRRDGNSELLLDAALEGARARGAEAQKVALNDLDMRACQACNDCLRTGECVLKDDMSPLYALLERADAIVIACPIYFSGLTAQTKMMIDRCQCLWARGENLGRPVGGGKKRKGAFISVGGDEKSVFRNAVGEVKAFYCAINVSYCEELLVSGVEKKGAIGERPATLKEAFELGKRIVSDSRQAEM